ncbi:putative ankyrin repeat-containing protein-like [Capsicum annuum]|nr:putative ankyrin repeat-containing protein-like [Capsicum annuum]
MLHVAAHYGRSHFAAEVLKISPAFLCHQNKKNETALHIAANEGHIEVIHLLLSITENHKETLMRMTDENGDTVLDKVARETSLYLAAEFGLREALSEILNSCKQPTSSAGPLNRTPLHAAVIQEHTAILYSQANVVSYLLKPRKWDKLVEDPDNDGNTTHHLLASSNFWGYVPLELKDHPRTKKMSYNKENKTPFDVAVSCTEWRVDKDRITPSLYHDFLNSIAQLGRRSPRLNQMDRQKIIFNQAKECDINIKGGFESDDNGPNKGMAILIRKSAFHAFFITDAIAFAFSAGAIFSYFYMATILVQCPFRIWVICGLSVKLELGRSSLQCQQLSLLL